MLLYSFKCLLKKIDTQLGKNSCGGTPGPIPNPEVKPVNAESTWREASREDRYLPSFFIIFCITLHLGNIFLFFEVYMEDKWLI